MLVEGASPEESEQYDLAGNYEMLVDGLMRYVSRKPHKGRLNKVPGSRPMRNADLP